MDTGRNFGFFDAFDEGRLTEDVDALLEGLFFNRFVIAAVAGFIGDCVVIIGFEQGQGCARFVSPSCLDATPRGFAEDTPVLTITKSEYINIVQLAIDERPRVVGGDIHGLDLLERAQRNHLRFPVFRDMDTLDSPDLEACAKALGMEGQFESVLVVIDQPFFYGFVVFALDINVLR